MAVAKPSGFSPFRTAGTNANNMQGTTYSIQSAEANAWYIGDTCKSVANADANGIPSMQKDTTGSVTIRGVVVGIINPFPGGVSIPTLYGAALPLELLSIPATKTQIYYVLVIEDQDTMFVAQDDNASPGNCIAANANKNSNITIANGSTVQSLSGSSLASTSFAVTATFPIKLVGLQQIAGNAFGGFSFWYCRINESELQGGVLGV